MNSTTTTLDRVVSDLRGLVGDDVIAGSSDADALSVLRGAGEALRVLEAVAVETVASRDAGFAHSHGSRNMNEMLQRMLSTDAPSAGKIVKAAAAVRREVSLVSGERLPARWPRMREALLDGVIGVAGVLAATGSIERAMDRIGGEERAVVDETLAGYARGHREVGESSDGGIVSDSGPRATPDDLRQASQYLAMLLDPDGAEPLDCVAQRNRFISVGRARNGVHPISGNLLPETAAQLQLIIDAFDNPRVGGAPSPGVRFGTSTDPFEEDPFNSDPRAVIDDRTLGQKRHDALAAALGMAARDDGMPTLGGAAPTLVVHAEASDIAAGSGWATVRGSDAPVPVAVAHQTACAGAVQRVLFDEGRVIGISVTDRVFTVHQRRAIIARDRECLIPGCHVSASWCEIHHVTEHARGGPTHTDNGVPLCWWHHRTLDSSGWEVRMAGGVPQIRGPAWWDPPRLWRTPRPILDVRRLVSA